MNDSVNLSLTSRPFTLPLPLSPTNIGGQCQAPPLFYAPHPRASVMRNGQLAAGSHRFLENGQSSDGSNFFLSSLNAVGAVITNPDQLSIFYRQIYDKLQEWGACNITDEAVGKVFLMFKNAIQDGRIADMSGGGIMTQGILQGRIGTQSPELSAWLDAKKDGIQNRLNLPQRRGGDGCDGPTLPPLLVPVPVPIPQSSLAPPVTLPSSPSEVPPNPEPIPLGPGSKVEGHELKLRPLPAWSFKIMQGAIFGVFVALVAAAAAPVASIALIGEERPEIL